MSARLHRLYTDSLAPKLQKDLGVSCLLAVPRLEKIVLNMGLGSRLAQDSKIIEAASKDLSLIAAQKPVVTRARRSIAGFKIREGMPLGLKVTLRKQRMYEFLDRLVTMAMPRQANYRGNKAKFDGRGNYTFGLRDTSVFYEVDQGLSSVRMGMDVSIVTTAKTDMHCLALLKGFDIPFVGEERVRG